MRNESPVPELFTQLLTFKMFRCLCNKINVSVDIPKWVNAICLFKHYHTCMQTERKGASKSVYVRVFHGLELLRYVLRCAIARQL